MSDRGGLPKEPFADIAVALRIEANHYADSDGELEVLLARLELTNSGRILANARRHTQMIAAGHYLMKAMCEHEQEIRAFLEVLEARSKGSEPKREHLRATG